MILGFLGTGRIASSVIEGIFKSKLKIKKIYISPRNKTIAKKLSKRFKKVTISRNNQQLIDESSDNATNREVTYSCASFLLIPLFTNQSDNVRNNS